MRLYIYVFQTSARLIKNTMDRQNQAAVSIAKQHIPLRVVHVLQKSVVVCRQAVADQISLINRVGAGKGVSEWVFVAKTMIRLYDDSAVHVEVQQVLVENKMVADVLVPAVIKCVVSSRKYSHL